MLLFLGDNFIVSLKDTHGKGREGRIVKDGIVIRGVIPLLLFFNLFFYLFFIIKVIPLGNP